VYTAVFSTQDYRHATCGATDMNLVVVSCYDKGAISDMSIVVNDYIIVCSLYSEIAMINTTVFEYEFITAFFFNGIFYPFYFRILTDFDVFANAAQKCAFDVFPVFFHHRKNFMYQFIE